MPPEVSVTMATFNVCLVIVSSPFSVMSAAFRLARYIRLSDGFKGWSTISASADVPTSNAF
jgi:hypothetical protein